MNVEMTWIEDKYKGPIKVAYHLYKNKWNARITLIFGRYVKRYFVLDLRQRSFCYYNDENLSNSHFISFSVLINLILGNKKSR